MADAKTTIIPFKNKGWVQKIDSASLDEGQYALLQNVQSFQEGTMSSRNGSKRLTSSSPGYLSTGIHSLAKLRLNSSSTWRYFGYGLDLYRSTAISGYSTIPPGNSLAAMSFSTIAAGVSAVSGDRISGVQYDSGPSGAPVLYVAGTARMVKDDGVTASCSTPRWGVMPRDQAVVAAITSRAITAISNAVEAVVASVGHGMADQATVNIYGATGGWVAINTAWTMTLIDDDSFSVPINSTGFGALSGTVTFTSVSGSDAAGGAAMLVPYSYCATARDPVTGAEGNPSPLMIDYNQITAVGLAGVTLTIGGIDSDHGRISTTAGDKSIAIYRAGGTLDDGLYRLLNYVTNPGSGGTVTYVDTAQDIDIIYSRIMEFDNDPPVPSTLKVPLVSPINYSDSTMHHGAVNNIVIAAADLPPGITDLRTVITPGSIVRITGRSWWPAQSAESLTETAVVRTVTSDRSFDVYTQQQFYDGPAHNVPITVEITTACAHGANIAATAFENVFVAGDPVNPHILYKCKNGRAEAFPLLNMVSGAVQQLRVGSPSNPIRGITEYNGELVCLNAANIFVVGFAANGQDMTKPTATPATHGVVGTAAWVKADNQIWYVGPDGLYSWRGGQETLRSMAVDFMFRVGTIDSVPPIDMTHPEKIVCGYHQNTVFIAFQDTGGFQRRMRYETLFDRWHYDIVRDNPGETADDSAVTAMATEAS